MTERGSWADKNPRAPGLCPHGHKWRWLCNLCTPASEQGERHPFVATDGQKCNECGRGRMNWRHSEQGERTASDAGATQPTARNSSGVAGSPSPAPLDLPEGVETRNTLLAWWEYRGDKGETLPDDDPECVKVVRVSDLPAIVAKATAEAQATIDEYEAQLADYYKQDLDRLKGRDALSAAVHQLNESRKETAELREALKEAQHDLAIISDIVHDEEPVTGTKNRARLLREYQAQCLSFAKAFDEMRLHTDALKAAQVEGDRHPVSNQADGITGNPSPTAPSPASAFPLDCEVCGRPKSWHLSRPEEHYYRPASAEFPPVTDFMTTFKECLASEPAELVTEEIVRKSMHYAWGFMCDDRSPTQSDLEFVDRVIYKAAPLIEARALERAVGRLKTLNDLQWVDILVALRLAGDGPDASVRCGEILGTVVLTALKEGE